MIKRVHTFKQFLARFIRSGLLSRSANPAFIDTFHEVLGHVQTVVRVDGLSFPEKIVKAIVHYRNHPLLIVECLPRLPSQGEHQLFEIVKHNFRLFKEFLVKRLVRLHMLLLLFPGIDLGGSLYTLCCIIFIIFKTDLIFHELKKWKLVCQQVRNFLQHLLVL